MRRKRRGAEGLSVTREMLARRAWGAADFAEGGVRVGFKLKLKLKSKFRYTLQASLRYARPRAGW
jgi:hypothetical protein